MVSPNDPEARGIAETITRCIPKWTFDLTQPLAGTTSGIIIEYNPNDPAAAARAHALFESLRACRLEVRGPIADLPTPDDKLPARLGRGGNNATLRIIVGHK